MFTMNLTTACRIGARQRNRALVLTAARAVGRPARSLYSLVSAVLVPVNRVRPHSSCNQLAKASLSSAFHSSANRLATSTTPHSTAVDPAETEALACLEKGTQKLEEGDVEGAKALYKRSVEIKRDAGSLFNLGVTHYHLKEFDEAIEAWKESISLQPSSPDAHTNLASAYIISPVSRPDLALHHLTIASSLAPEDPEIAFNLAAVLEACGRLEEALTHYKRSKEFGVERAEMHIRNVSAKIFGKRMKEAQESEDPK